VKSIVQYALSVLALFISVTSYLIGFIKFPFYRGENCGLEKLPCQKSHSSMAELKSEPRCVHCPSRQLCPLYDMCVSLNKQLVDAGNLFLSCQLAADMNG